MCLLVAILWRPCGHYFVGWDQCDHSSNSHTPPHDCTFTDRYDKAFVLKPRDHKDFVAPFRQGQRRRFCAVPTCCSPHCCEARMQAKETAVITAPSQATRTHARQVNFTEAEYHMKNCMPAFAQGFWMTNSMRVCMNMPTKLQDAVPDPQARYMAKKRGEDPNDFFSDDNQGAYAQYKTKVTNQEGVLRANETGSLVIHAELLRYVSEKDANLNPVFQDVGGGGRQAVGFVNPPAVGPTRPPTQYPSTVAGAPHHVPPPAPPADVVAPSQQKFPSKIPRPVHPSTPMHSVRAAARTDLGGPPDVAPPAVTASGSRAPTLLPGPSGAPSLAQGSSIPPTSPSLPRSDTGRSSMERPETFSELAESFPGGSRPGSRQGSTGSGGRPSGRGTPLRHVSPNPTSRPGSSASYERERQNMRTVFEYMRCDGALQEAFVWPTVPNWVGTRKQLEDMSQSVINLMEAINNRPNIEAFSSDHREQLYLTDVRRFKWFEAKMPGIYSNISRQYGKADIIEKMIDRMMDMWGYVEKLKPYHDSWLLNQTPEFQADMRAQLGRSPSLERL